MFSSWRITALSKWGVLGDYEPFITFQLPWFSGVFNCKFQGGYFCLLFVFEHSEHMDISKNRGTPKWMVIVENPIKIDDLGVPLFSETSTCCGAKFGSLVHVKLRSASKALENGPMEVWRCIHGKLKLEGGISVFEIYETSLYHIDVFYTHIYIYVCTNLKRICIYSFIYTYHGSHTFNACIYSILVYAWIWREIFNY